MSCLCRAAPTDRINNTVRMPEKERREVDKMLRGLAPLHQRQLSVSSSNALEMFAVMEVRRDRRVGDGVS